MIQMRALILAAVVLAALPLRAIHGFEYRISLVLWIHRGRHDTRVPISTSK
jgi:hypothetical protein